MEILDSYYKQASNYKNLPVVREIFADTLTPVQVLRKLKEKGENVFLLESAENTGVRGRYSFLGYEPKLEIKVKDSKVYVNGIMILIDTNEVIEVLLEEYKQPNIEGLPPFTGGLVGYFSYDYFKYKEPTLKLKNPDPYGFFDYHLYLFDKVIVFDHFRDKVLLIKNVSTENFEENKKRAEDELKVVEETILSPSTKTFPAKITKAFEPEFSFEEFSKVINKAKDYIVEGDIFQVVPSNRIAGELSGSLFPAYRVMRTENPSPYMFYLQYGNEEIAGASPETLIRLEGKTVSTFPIAGTRPRGKSPQEDLRLEEELLADPKELAEHNMLVDLGRNDIGQVSKFGTVQVSGYKDIQRYSKVMHITSKVTGELEDDVSPVKALTAVLPAGTLSGAPKIRACQIIEELETQRRGPYGGALGYFSFNGNMDFCILIRSVFKKRDKTYVQSGGGIVYDSKEEPEYLETINKAAAVVEALKQGEGLS